MEKRRQQREKRKRGLAFSSPSVGKNRDYFKKKKKGNERKRTLTVAKETNYLFGYGNTL